MAVALPAEQTDTLFPVLYRVSDTLDSFSHTFHVHARSAAGPDPEPPPPLRALSQDGGLSLAWTHRPGSFVVQSATDLATPEWRNVPGTPTLAEGTRFLSLTGTNDAEFFRLKNLDAVRLTHATPRETTLFPGTNVFVDLGVTGDIGVDDVLEVTEFGLFTATVRLIPGSALHGEEGFGFHLDGDALPVPRVSVAVRVLDGLGGGHGLTVFHVTNSAATASGTAPTLASVHWLDLADRLQLPFSDRETVTPPLVVTVADADGDLARFGLTITDPSGTATGREITASELGTGPTQTVLFPITFNRLSEQGTWRVEVVAMDSAGRRSTPRTTSLQVLSFSPNDALVGPAITFVQPTNGPAGTVVTLTTTGLGPAALSNAAVRIGGRTVTTIEVGTNLLRVLAPTDTVGGVVELRTPLGRATAARRFHVIPEVNIAPAVANALAGQRLQFGFDRRLPDDAVTIWSMVGPGSVSPEGLFIAPVGLPHPTNTLVRASVQVAGTNLVSDAFVAIEADAVPRGAADIVAADGGVVWSEDLLARVEIPASALPADARVSIERRMIGELPPAAAVPEFLGALELGPDGAAFAQPVTVFIPLTRSLPPGTELALRFWNAASSAWIDEGVVAEVEPDGVLARARIAHFSIPAVFGSLVVSGSDPVITAVIPNQILEGEERPILIEGSNLDGGVTLEVRRPDGTWFPGPLIGPLVRGPGAGLMIEDGSKAAFVFDCPVLTDVGEGQTVPLEIRVRRGTGPVSSAAFTIVGLDEFDAATFGMGVSGQRLTNLYSQIVVDRLLANLRHDVLDLQATRWVILNGEVDLSGRYGASSTGAAMVFDTGVGDRAGIGIGGDARFTATYELPATTMRVGFGGAQGANARDLDSLQALAGCLGDDARDCFEEILEDLRDDPFGERDDAPGDLAALLARLPDGRRGASGLWSGAPSQWFALRSHGVISDNPRFTRGFGPGTGGGGGGNSGTLFGDPSSRQAGAAGGEGGGAVRFLSGRDLFIDATVRANGGHGGNGAWRSIAGHRLQGGGGGGGGAGAVRLLAGRTLLFTGTNGHVEARGGRPGFGGIATRPENVGFGLWAAIPYSEDPETPEGMQVTEGALFDELALANSVVTRNVLTLVARRVPKLGTHSPNPDRAHVVVRRVDGSESRRCYFHPVGSPGSLAFRVNLVFFPGANVVELGGPDETLLNRHVVCLSGPDPDNDGLSTADELALGTNPNAADSDGDTLSDLDELLHGGDPTSADSDGDLLRDDVKIALGTYPNSVDSDGDGLWDSLEVFLGRSPTETSPRDLHYGEGTVFVIADNERGEKILALLDPLSGRLGALGRVPGNRADGLTFDNRGTLYLAQGDELFQWAGSVPYERITPPGPGAFIGVGAGSPRSGGGVLRQIEPYGKGGAYGPAFPLGRADGLAMVHVNTNEFLVTTSSRVVLRVRLDRTLNTLAATPLATTLAPCPLMAIVPCVDGCFDPHPVTGSGPIGSGFVARGLRLGDFNQDGFLDAAISGQSGQQAKVHILHGAGDGTFTAVAEHILGHGIIESFGKIATGFADGDAPDDLAVARNTAFLLHGNAAGTFNTLPMDELTPNNLASRLVEFTDLDHDGQQDLVRFGEILATHLGGALNAS